MTEFRGGALSEVDWQHKIIKAERAKGNYAGKWSSSMQTGKPDLILHLLGIGGVLMEVKLFRGVRLDRDFSRKIEATDKQREELKLYEQAGGTGVIGVVADFGGGEARLYVLPWATERLDSASSTGPLVFGSWAKGKGFPLDIMVRSFREVNEK